MATTATGSPSPDHTQPAGTHDVPSQAATPAPVSAPVQPNRPPRPAPSGQPAPISRLGIAAVVVTVVLWASAFVGIRAVGPSFSPGALTLGRLSVAAVVLGLLVVPKLRG